MPRCLAAASIAAIALFATAPDVRAASFDCGRAATGVENAICEDRSLSALDDQMARNYRALLNKTSGAAESRIRADQKNWLRQRNACGDDPRCLNREYQARIQGIASSGGAAAPRQTAAVENEERPRGLVSSIFDRNKRAAEPAPAEQAERKPGLLARMIDRITPDLGRKDEEPEKAEPAKNEPVQLAPQQPLKIVGQRPAPRTVSRESEPLVPSPEPQRQKTLVRAEPAPQLVSPEPAPQKSVSRQIEPQVAAAEPVRQKYVLRPAVEQTQAAQQTPQVTARRESGTQRKWEDLSTGSSLGAPEPTLRATRTEPAREDKRRVQTTRVKPEPVEETAPVETPALTYAPENGDEPPAQRILRQEPRVQMIKPLIVRDRAPATEPSPPSVADEALPAQAVVEEQTSAPAMIEEAAPVDETETAAIAPDAEPLALQDMPALAALPNETPALPKDTERVSSVPSPVREALKSRFDTAYGNPNRIDLLAPTRQTRHFDPTRFDIFDEPAGG